MENSIAGIRSRVGHQTTLISTYLMGNDYFETLDEINHDMERGIPLLGIGNRCHIQNAIIDKDCRIGDDVKIIGGTHLPDGDHSLYTIKDGIIVVKKRAVVPNGYTIGV
jgi:glucose-1-phosphate adenylyltransferase